MQKPRIRIADSVFAHGTSLGSGDLKIYPTYFDWYRGDDNINDLIVITDSHLHLVDNYTEKIKVAWLLEPPSINSASYAFVMENHHKFDYVLTHQFDFMKRLRDAGMPNKKNEFYIFGGCWIEPHERYRHFKTKNISIIASNKTQTEGHRLRHEVIKALGDKIDVYGNGYQFVQNKADALRDYRYTIVIENEKSDVWITEKLIDALQCGCIPIYWGGDGYTDILNQGGVLHFTTVDYLKTCVLPVADEAFYDSRYLSILKNFMLSSQFVISEDVVWRSLFADLYYKIERYYDKDLHLYRGR